MIGAVFRQRVGLVVAIHAEHQAEASAAPCLYPGNRVLRHQWRCADQHRS